MNSIDRKLARCAREIEEAKPKVMSFGDFASRTFMVHAHNGKLYTVTAENSRQIKGAAREEVRTSLDNCCAQPSVAAPPLPSTEKAGFKVGDTVTHYCFPDRPVVITRLGHDPSGEPSAWYVRLGETKEIFGHLKNLTLVLPSEPKADAEGWIAHDGKSKCPVPSGTHVEVRLRDGHTSKGKALVDVGHCVSDEQWYDTGDGDQLTIVAYRVIK